MTETQRPTPLTRRLEVRIEDLIISVFPEILDGQRADGRLADLVVAILKEAVPTYRSYQD